MGQRTAANALIARRVATRFTQAANQLTDQELKNRISDAISDYGDEYGWDEKPSVNEVLSTLADEARKDRVSYDAKKARQFAEEAVRRLR